MKKFSLVFNLSFIPYFLVLLVLDKISARTSADIIFFIFLLSVLYQLTFLFYFRKKENTSFLRALARMILGATFALSAFNIYYTAYIYVNGYIKTDWVGNYINTYYGLEALKESLSFYIFPTILFILTTYQGLYFLISWIIKNRQLINNKEK